MNAFSYIPELGIVVELLEAPSLRSPRTATWYRLPDGTRFILARPGLETFAFGLKATIENFHTLSPEKSCVS